MTDARMATITLAGVLGGVALLVLGAAVDSPAVQIAGALGIAAAVVVNAVWRYGAAHYARMFGVIAVVVALSALVSVVWR